MLKNIEAVFNPKSIAIIGASARDGSVGKTTFQNLLSGGYKGVLYPVNLKADSILGVKCYPRILDIPDAVDMAVIIVPADVVADTLEECGKKGVKGAIVITAGFKEIGPEGLKMEKKVVEVAQKHNIALVGPNCLGIINTDPLVSMNASFGRFMPNNGKIAFISQSGALCTAVLDYAKGENIGFSKFISMGNKAGVSELDLLVYLKDDPQTKVILMYVEDLVHPQEFINVVRENSII